MRDRYGSVVIYACRCPNCSNTLFATVTTARAICLFRLIGEHMWPTVLMKTVSFDDIVIASTEDEMHRDIYLCLSESLHTYSYGRAVRQISTVRRCATTLRCA